MKAPSGWLRVSAAALTGAAVYLMLVLLLPKAPSPSVLGPNPLAKAGPIVAPQQQIMQFVNSPYVLVPFFLVICFLAISTRDRADSWINAAVAGYVLSALTFHWLFHWV